MGMFDRGIQLIVFFVAVAMAIFIIKTFEDKPNIMTPLLSFMAGILSGLGLGRAFGRKGG